MTYNVWDVKLYCIGSGFDLVGCSSQSSEHLSIFGLHGATLPCRGLGLVGLAIYLVD